MSSSVLRALLRRRPCRSPASALALRRSFAASGSGGGGKDGGKDGGKGDDEDDSFGMDDFIIDDGDGDDGDGAKSSAQQKSADMVADAAAMEAVDAASLTPQIASDLVKRMVDMTSSSGTTSRIRTSARALPELTVHTLEVLHASRICTNAVHETGSVVFKHPVERRVIGHLLVDRLNLSAPARQALLLLAGPRVRKEGDAISVKISYDRLPTKQENRVYVVTLLHRLVKEAKEAVGETVDLTPLTEWTHVVQQASVIAADDVASGGADVQRLLGDAGSTGL